MLCKSPVSVWPLHLSWLCHCPMAGISGTAAAPWEQKRRQVWGWGPTGRGWAVRGVLVRLGSRSKAESGGGLCCPCCDGHAIIWFEQLPGGREMWVELETIPPILLLFWGCGGSAVQECREEALLGPSEPSQHLSTQDKQPFVQYPAPPVLSLRPESHFISSDYPLVPSIISLVYFGLNRDAEVIFALGVSSFHPITTTPPTAVSNLLVLFLISFWG